jgi:predicted DNA binding CopG/RHH family protein
MARLDTDEKALADSVERGEWRSVRDLQRQRKRYQKYAEATLRKDRRVNIRISGKDLTAIQKLAIEEGLPYQTLIASLLHKYASGRLVERSLTRRSSRRRAAETKG